MGRGTRWAAGVALAATALVVAYVDFLTGSGVGMSPLYAVPAAVLAWDFGRGPGIAGAVLTGAAWSLADHATRPALGVSVAAWNDSLRILGLVTLAYLLATVRRTQHDLRLALAQRDEFLSLVAHELRAPVAAIELVATALSRSAATLADQKPILDRLLRQSRQLRALAEDILSMGRLEAGVERVEPEVFDLRTLVAELVDESDRVTIDASWDPLPVRADRQHIRRALANLLENALKFSGDAEPVEVSIRAAADSVSVSVRDHGIGFEPHEAARLFEKYGRLDDPQVRRTPGVGLGLYLARLSLQANGGSVEAASGGRGLGATFTVVLPLAVDTAVLPQLAREHGDA